MLTIKETVAQEYPSALAAVIDSLGEQRLDPGRKNAEAHQRIEALDQETMFERGVEDKELAQCCLSGLLLAANYLDASHDISQDCPSQTGSYWHGLMHRREPDYSNAAYWFRKVGTHPLYATLPAAIAPHVNDASPELQALATTWDPFAFNAVCERNLKGGAEQERCQSIQAVEWALLFDFCYQGASA